MYIKYDLISNTSRLLSLLTIFNSEIHGLLMFIKEKIAQQMFLISCPPMYIYKINYKNLKLIKNNNFSMKQYI